MWRVLREPKNLDTLRLGYKQNAWRLNAFCYPRQQNALRLKRVLLSVHKIVTATHFVDLSHNSQTCTTRFRISELGNLVQIFRHFRFGVSERLTNYSYWDNSLRWIIWVKIMFILIETSPGLRIKARWGDLPISMVLQPEESLKSEMLSLARTSKYVNNLVC